MSFDVKLKWQVDLATYCGCEGAELDTNNPPGGCSLCKDGEEFNDLEEEISGGFPLTNFPLTCQYVNEVSPFLKYISGCDCEEFQDKYGTDLCCKATASETQSPTAAPVSSAMSTIHVPLNLFGLVASSVFVFW